MKKIGLIVSLLLGTVCLSAQNEVPGDSIAHSPSYNHRIFGDFMLDMSLMTPPKLPSFSTNLLGPDATKDYNLLFTLPLQWIISNKYVPQSYTNIWGMFSTSPNLQGATFRMNDNMRLTTYGQYTLDGRKIPNPGALPWEKNNFVGGMDLKFNKNFGIRIEVRQGRNPAYPY